MTEPVTIDAVLNVDQRSAAKEIEQLSRVTPKINLQIDARGFSDQIQEAAKGTKVKLGFDTSPVEGELRHISNSTSKVKLGIDTGFLKGQIEEASNSTKVKLGVNIGSVKADLTQVFKDAGKSLGTEFQGVLQNTKIDVKGGGILGGLFSAITSPVRAIATGLFEGIGVNISDNLGKGISQGVEKQLAPIIGSTQLIGKIAGESLTSQLINSIDKGFQRVSGIPRIKSIFDDIRQDFAKEIAVFNKQVLIESRSQQYEQGQKDGRKLRQAQKQTGINLKQELEARPQRTSQLRSSLARSQSLSQEDSASQQQKLNDLLPRMSDLKQLVERLTKGRSQYKELVDNKLLQLNTERASFVSLLEQSEAQGNKVLSQSVTEKIQEIEKSIRLLSESSQKALSSGKREYSAKTLDRLIQRQGYLKQLLSEAIEKEDDGLSNVLSARIGGLGDLIETYSKNVDFQSSQKQLVRQLKTQRIGIKKEIKEARKQGNLDLAKFLEETDLADINKRIKSIDLSAVPSEIVNPSRVKKAMTDLQLVSQEYASLASLITERVGEIKVLNAQISALDETLSVPTAIKELEILGANVEDALKAISQVRKEKSDYLSLQRQSQEFVTLQQKAVESIDKAQRTIDEIQDVLKDDFVIIEDAIKSINLLQAQFNEINSKIKAITDNDISASLVKSFNEQSENVQKLSLEISQLENEITSTTSKIGNSPDVLIQLDLQDELDYLNKQRKSTLIEQQKALAKLSELQSDPIVKSYLSLIEESRQIEQSLKNSQSELNEFTLTPDSVKAQEIRDLIKSYAKKKEQLQSSLSSEGESLAKTLDVLRKEIDTYSASQKLIFNEALPKRVIAVSSNLERQSFGVPANTPEVEGGIDRNAIEAEMQTLFDNFNELDKKIKSLTAQSKDIIHNDVFKEYLAASEKIKAIDEIISRLNLQIRPLGAELQSASQIIANETQKRDQFARSLQEIVQNPAINFDETIAEQKILTEQFRVLSDVLKLSFDATKQSVESINTVQQQVFRQMSKSVEEAFLTQKKQLKISLNSMSRQIDILEKIAEQTKSSLEQENLSQPDKDKLSQTLTKIQSDLAKYKTTKERLATTLANESNFQNPELIESIVQQSQIANEQNLRALEQLLKTLQKPLSVDAVSIPQNNNVSQVKESVEGIQDKINNLSRSVRLAIENTVTNIVETPKEWQNIIDKAIVEVEKILNTPLANKPLLLIGDQLMGGEASAIGGEVLRISNQLLHKVENGLIDHEHFIDVLIHETLHLYQEQLAKKFQKTEDQITALRSSPYVFSGSSSELNTENISKRIKFSVDSGVARLKEVLSQKGITGEIASKIIAEVEMIEKLKEESAYIFALRNREPVAGLLSGDIDRLTKPQTTDNTNLSKIIEKNFSETVTIGEDLQQAINFVLKTISEKTGVALSQNPSVIIGKLKDNISFTGQTIGNDVVLLNESVINDLESFQDNLFVVIHEFFHLFQNELTKDIKNYGLQASKIRSSVLNISGTSNELQSLIQSIGLSIQEATEQSVRLSVDQVKDVLRKQGVSEPVLSKLLQETEQLTRIKEEGANVFALRNQDAIAEAIRQQFNLATETVSTAIVPSVQKTGITATVKNGLQHITDTVESQVVALFNNALRSIPNDPNTIDITARQITSLSEIDAGIVKDLALKGSQETAINVLSGITTTFKALEGAEQAVLSLDPTGMAKVVTNVLKPLAVFVAASQVPGANLLAGEATQLVSGALTPFTGALGADVTAALGGAITQMFHNIPLVGGNIEATLIHGTQQLINAAVSGGTEAIATAFTAITGGQLIRGGTEALISKALPEANQQKALQAGKQVERASTRLIEITAQRLEETADLFQKTTQAISVSRLPASKSVFPSLLPNIDNIRGFLESNLNKKGLTDVYKQLTGTSGVRLNRAQLTGVIEEKFKENSKSVQQAIAKIESSGVKSGSQFTALEKPAINESLIIQETQDLIKNSKTALTLYQNLSDQYQNQGLAQLKQLNDFVDTQLRVILDVKSQFNVSGKTAQSLGGSETVLRQRSQEIRSQIKEVEARIRKTPQLPDVANFLPEGINATGEQVEKAQDFVTRMAKIVAQLSNVELLPENIPQLNLDRLTKAGTAGYNEFQNSVVLNQKDFNLILDNFFTDDLLRWMNQTGDLLDSVYDRIELISALSHELRHAAQSNFGAVLGLEDKVGRTDFAFQSVDLSSPDGLNLYDGVMASVESYTERVINPDINEIIQEPHQFDPEMWRSAAEDLKRERISAITKIEEDAYQFEKMMYMRILNILKELQFFETNTPHFDYYSKIQTDAVKSAYPELSLPALPDVPNFLPEGINNIKALTQQINQSLQQSNEEIRQVANLSVAEQIYQRDVLKEIAEKLHNQQGIIASSKIKRGEKKPLLAELDRQIQIIESVMSSVNTALRQIDLGDIEGEFRHYEDRIAKIQSIVTNQSPDARLAEINRTIDFLINQLREIQDFGDAYNHAYDRLFQNLNAKYESIDENSAIEKASQEILKLENTFPAMQKFRESIWGSNPVSPAIETKPVRETTSPPPLPPLPPIPTPVEEVKKVQEQVKRAIKPESMPFLPLPTTPVEEVKKVQTKIQQAIVPDPWELPLIEEVKKIQAEVKQSVTPKLLLLPAAVDVTEEVKKVQEQVKRAIKPEPMPQLPPISSPVEEVKKVQAKIQQAIVPDPWELPLIEEVKKIQAEVKQSVTPRLLLLPAAVDVTEEVKKVQEQVKRAVTPPPLPPLPPPINVPSNEVKKTQEQVKKTVTTDLPPTPKTIASILDEIQQKIQKEADFLQKSIEKSTALLSSIKNAFPDKPVAIPDVIVSESDRLRDLEFDINQTSLEDREKNILQRIKILEAEIQKRQTQILEPLQAKVIEVQSIEAVYQEILSQIDLYEKAKLALTEKLYRETDLAKRQAIKQSFGRYQSKVLSLKSDLTSLDPQRVSVESFKSQLTEQKTIQEQLQGELLYNQVAVKELQDTIQSVNQQYQRLENSNKTTSETYTLDGDFKQVRQRVRELSDAIQYQQTSSIEKVQRVFSIAQKRKYYLDAMVEELANKLNQLTSQKLLAQSQLSSARFPSTKQTKLNEVNQLESQIKLTQSELDSAVRIQSKVTQSFDQALEELNREIGVQSQLKSELAENQTRLAQIRGKRKAVNQRLQQIDDDLNIYLSQKPFTPTLKETFQRINVQRQGEAITRRVNQRYGVGDGEFPRQGNELRDLATSAIDSVTQRLTGQMSELEKLNILGQSSEQIKVLRGLLSSKVNQFKSSQQEIQVLNQKQVDLQAKINQLITESVTATQQRRQQIAKEVLQLDQLMQNDRDRLNQLKEYVKVGEKAERQLRSLSNIELNINVGTGNVESVRRDLIDRVSKGAFSQRALSETAGQEAKIQAKINQLIQKSSQVDDGGKQQIQSTIDKLNEMLDKLRERSVILKDNITIGKQAEIQLKRLAQLETGSGSVSPNQIRASVKELERLQTQLSQPARKGFFESIRELTNHLADRLPPSIKTLFPLFNSLKFAIGGFLAYQVLDPINWWFNLRFGIESLVRTVEKLEASKVKIESFGGSFEEAIKTAERYKVSLDTVVDGYAQLTAATQGTNLEGLKTQKILESVAQSSRVFGLSDEDTKGFLLAMRQILSGSTLQLEELNQISERLPGALALSAKAMRTTTNDLRDMTSAAAVSSEEFAVNFAEQLRLVSQGGLRASLTTIQSERIELLNKFRQLQLTLGDVFGGTIKGGINLLTNLAKGAAIAAKGLSYVLPPLTAIAAVFTAYKLPSIILATSNALKVLFANAAVVGVLNALSSGFTSLSAAVKGFIVAQITLSPVLASATFSQRSAAIANISTALATNTNTAAIQGNTVALIANRVALFANNQLLKASIALDIILSSGIAHQTKAIIANTIATKGMNAVLFVGAGIAKGLGLAIKGLNLAIAASPLIGLVITAKLATDVFGDLFKEVNRNKEELKTFKAELDKAVNFKSDTFNLKAKVEINKEEFQKELNFFSREINKPFGNLVIGLTSSIIRATSGLVIQPVKSFISLLQGNLRGAFSDLAGIIKLPVKDIQNTFSKDNEGFFINRAIIAQADAFLEAEKAATEYYNFLQRIKAGEPVDPEQITQYISSLESYNQQLRSQKGLTEAQIAANQVVITQNEQLIKQLQEEKDAIEGTKIRYSEIAKARKAASDSAKKAEVSALHEIEKLTEQGAVKSEEAEIRKQKATLATAELELKAQQEAQEKIKEAIEDRLRYQKRKETGNLAGEIELDPDVLKAIADGNLTRLKELGIDKKFVEDIEKAQTEITELEKKAVLGRIKLARMEKEEKERLAKERQDKSVKDLEDEYKKANDLIERKEQERIIAIKQLRTSGGLSDTEVEKQLESATKQRLSEELKAEEENIKKIKQIRIESGLSESDRKQAIEDKEEKLLEAQKQRNSIVIQILDDQISKEKELKEAIYDNQKSAIDIISSTNSLLSEQLSQLEESINRAKELSQLRFDLGTTQNTADSTRRDIRVTRLERAKEILKQLREDENLGNNERKSLVQELAELGVNSRMTELSLTREINRLEEENRQAKLEASQREFNFKQQQIDLERQSLEITAKKNVLDAANQLNQLKQSRLDQSKTIRDNRGLLKQAQNGLIAATTPQEKVEAEKQLKSAEERLSLSQEQLGIIDQQINNSYEQLEFNKSYITQLKEINQLKQAQLDTERAISLEETKASNTREKFKGISESAQLRDNTQSQQIKKAEKESQAKIDEAKKARDQALATAKTAEERKQALEDYQKSIDQTKEESGNAIAKISQQFNQQRQAQVQAERLQKRPTIPFDINQIYRQLPQLQFAPQGRQDEHLLIKEVQLLRSEISKVKPSINQPLDITVHAQSDPTEIARKVSNAVADRDLILLKQLGLT